MPKNLVNMLNGLSNPWKGIKLGSCSFISVYHSKIFMTRNDVKDLIYNPFSLSMPL